jgi:hypothetical protein
MVYMDRRPYELGVHPIHQHVQLAGCCFRLRGPLVIPGVWGGSLWANGHWELVVGLIRSSRTAPETLLEVSPGKLCYGNVVIK